MTKSNNRTVNDLSPDGFSRFFYIVDIIEKIFINGSQTISILDVGGGSEYVDQQLKARKINYNLTVLDIIERPKSLNKNTKYIQADATNMSLKDNSYDVVISTDVLEHIYPDKKTDFVYECTRVAKKLCILAAPFNTVGVNNAEIVVNDFNKKLFGVGQDWLEEHLEFGKPEIYMVERVLKDQKLPYLQFGTCNLNTWLLNTHVNLIDAKLGLDSRKHTEINHEYNSNILEMGDVNGATYRQFFVVFIEDSLKEMLKPNVYTVAKMDHKKAVDYMSRLMELLSDRIQKALANESRQNKEIYNLQQQISVLEGTVASQKQTIENLKPILNIIHSRPSMIIRKAIYGISKESHSDK